MKWPTTIATAQARAVQRYLRDKVRIVPLRREPRYIAGVDAAFSDVQVFAAACLYRLPELTCIEQARAVRKLVFPYVPGYLSFREGPAITETVRKLVRTPDIILVDGQGIAHPRGIGIASFLGVLLDIPTIGCAKSRLVGNYREPGAKKGSRSPLKYEGKIVGSVVRTRDDIKPLFISPGHRIDRESSIRTVLSCIGQYRIPEPIRCADMLSKKMKHQGSTELPDDRRPRMPLSGIQGNR